MDLAILVVSQPDFGSTRMRAIHRLSGTLIGGVLGGLLLLLRMQRIADYGVIAASAFVYGYFLRRHYGVAVVFITIMVVALTEAGGSASLYLTFERLCATAAGGGLALLGARFLWPFWEQTRQGEFLASALRANAAYLQSVMNRLELGGTYGPTEVDAKRTADSAAADLMASLARRFADPATVRGDVEQAAALAAGDNRITRIINLMLMNTSQQHEPITERMKSHATEIEQTLAKLADHVIGENGSSDDLPKLVFAHQSSAATKSHPVEGHLAAIGAELDGMLSTFERLSETRTLPP